MKDPTCIFCQIVEGKAPCHKVWEDEHHIAFLTIFPNTDGFTVVATKEHYPSDAFENDDQVLSNLVLSAKKVAKKINAAFDDVGRTGMFLEGFGVNHLHAKLFPMHGTGDMNEWKKLESNTFDKKLETKFFTKYEGYLSSHGGTRADDTKLATIAEKIRNA